MNQSINTVKNFVNNLSFEAVKEKALNVPYNFKVSEQGNLYMLSFTDASKMDLEVVRSMNGVIFEKGTNKLIHYSFQKAYEGIWGENLDNNKDAFKLTEPTVYSTEISTEGTHIKLYHYNGEWNIGTSRSINGALSHWNNNKSFKEMFLECASYLNFDVSSLDTGFCYSYVMQHPENKISCYVNEPYIGLLNSVNLETYEICSGTTGFTVEKQIDQILSELENPDCNTNFIVYINDGRRIKLTNKKFKERHSFVNNDQDMKRVYVKSLKNSTSSRLRELFPEFSDTFNFVDFVIASTVRAVHSTYMDKFIHKMDTVVPEHFEKSIKQLHWGYRQTKEKVTKNKVNELLMNLPVKILMYVLNI
jgi:hypothetical protein